MLPRNPGARSKLVLDLCNMSQVQKKSKITSSRGNNLLTALCIMKVSAQVLQSGVQTKHGLKEHAKLAAVKQRCKCNSLFPLE